MSTHLNDLEDLRADLTGLIEAADTLEVLEKARVSALGKKGSVSALMKTLGGMDPAERKEKGPAYNAFRDDIAGLIKEREAALKAQALEARLQSETIDITLPPRFERSGHVHPLSRTMDELVDIFGHMGFTLADGPDIEDDWHNFTALNFPPGHPAREMQDTFFLSGDVEGQDGEAQQKLLRTHTSSVQVRHMTDHEPPVQIICMGRTYRSDYDMTHTPMFHQVEGLMVDTDVNMGHLKGCLMQFVRAFFEVDDLPLRFRPSFFPFVEPGAEVDIGYVKDGEGIRLGRAEDPAQQRWMEILGAGMVHPRVLKNCGIDPDVYQGFAFGAGIERITMLKYGIPDLRTFFSGDSRWLDHYGFETIS